jgi:acyl-homoserine-lactone acylase
MIKARNLEEFEAAERRLQMPCFNTLYADREGHIMYLFGGRIPRRPGKNWDFWRGVIPGNSARTLWTETLDYWELPKLIDPETGWLHNSNDPPWTSTIPQILDPLDFPAYIAPNFMPFRPQRSAHMLVGKEKLCFEDLVRLKHSTRAEAADRLLDDLLKAVEESGRDRALRAAEVLASWDRRTDAASRGAVLFLFWARKLDWGDLSVPWNPDCPLATPDGLQNPIEAVSKLEEAALEVEETYGNLDVPWGDVFRIRYGNQDLPANGGPDFIGIFRQLEFDADKDGKYRVSGGESYYAVIEFGTELRAEALLSYGNSTQPGSPHRGDQLALFAEKKLRKTWRTRSSIQAHLEKREVLKPPF